VLTGAIAAESEGKLVKASNQLDVLVVDTFEYPPLLRTGDLAVVLAPSVHVVVEAKSDLNNDKSKKDNKFRQAMTQIGRAKAAETSMLTALYCFGAPAQSATLRGWIQDLIKSRKELIQDAEKESDPTKKEDKLTEASYYTATNLPDLILSDEGAIAIREVSEAEENKLSRVQYGFYDTVDKNPTIVALASKVLAHISKVRGANIRSQTLFNVLIKHFDTGYEKSNQTEPLDVSDEQELATNE
jgi:hypothetical protein